MKKVCNKCKSEKSLDEFFNANNSKDGKYSICKKCKTKSYKIYVESNRERVNELSRKYQKKNKDAIAKRKKERYLENIKNPEYLERVNKLRKESYERRKINNNLLEKRRNDYHNKMKNDPEFVLKKRKANKKWADSNKEKVKSSRKRTYENNKEKNLSYGRNAFKNLTDGAVRKLFCKGGLLADDIPQELVDLKRVQLLIHREIKK